MKPHARLVLYALREILGNGKSDISYTEISQECGISRANAINSVNWLVENRYILREKSFFEDGGAAKNVYKILNK